MPTPPFSMTLTNYPRPKLRNILSTESSVNAERCNLVVARLKFHYEMLLNRKLHHAFYFHLISSPLSSAFSFIKDYIGLRVIYFTLTLVCKYLCTYRKRYTINVLLIHYTLIHRVKDTSSNIFPTQNGSIAHFYFSRVNPFGEKPGRQFPAMDIFSTKQPASKWSRKSAKSFIIAN
jgi:hypothetical protein